MSNVPDQILQDRAQLIAWMNHNAGVKIDARQATANGASLSGLDLSEADFRNASLQDADFSRSNLTLARLEEADLQRARLDGANLSRARLARANCAEASLGSRANCQAAFAEQANFTRASAREADFRDSYLAGAILVDSDLVGADFSRATLTGVDFLRCDLRGARFYASELTNTSWRGARIDSKTDFTAAVWRPQHDAPNDNADQLRLDFGRSILNWGTIRWVGRLHLFAGSYFLMTATLAVVTAIGWVNETTFLKTIQYPVPLPPRLIMLLIGSTLLAVGSTIFEAACPPLVKEYSRTQWVNELRRSGVQYVSGSLKRPLTAATAFVLVAVGGSITAFVFVDRLIAALRIAWGAVTGT